MMDGSVQNVHEGHTASATDQTGTLRQRVKSQVADPEANEEAMRDLEYNRNITKSQKSNIEYDEQDASPYSGLHHKVVGDNEVRTFPQNTFSFLLLARYPVCEKAQPEYINGRNDVPIPRKKTRDYLCLPFWCALSVLILQLAIYTLALQNATNFGDEKNPFNFPIDVDLSTRAAELFAVMITVYTENNLFQGVDLFVQSYKTLIETPGVTIYKYYVTATAAVLVGLYGIFVTFIIIMQAEGVVDLLLDFTAMEFVAALDDASYILAIRGFFGTAMKLTAQVVETAEYTPRDKRKWLRKWPLFLLFAAVMTCYIIVRVNQGNRSYGDNEIYVQFHDSVHPWLSTLSGVYIGCNLPSSDHSSVTKGKLYKLGRTMYTRLSVAECEKSWRNEDGAFFFCDQQHWVFAVGEDKLNPCDKWTMKSVKPTPSNSDEYDIMTHSMDLWLAQDPTRTSGTGVVEQIQFLAGFQPSQNAGRNCSVLASTGNVFSYPFYAKLEDSRQTKSFATERPVYFAGDDTDGEYIFHTGRRWVVVKANKIPGCVHSCKTTENCCKLDPYTANYTVSFISGPMDLRTVGDTWIPSSELIWYKATSNNGNSSKPIVDQQSLVDQIDVIDALASVGSFPNKEEEARLIDLHLQSARLSCLCDGGDLNCEKNVACGDDETTVWIDLQTDSRPQDTYFVVAGNETWSGIEQEAAADLLFSSVRQSVNSSGVTLLNTTGFFDWQNVWKSGFDSKANYQFTTCLPKKSCGVVYAEDAAGDGITFPGRFNVFLNTKKMERDRGGRTCVFDLCQESATCSDSSLRTTIFNPEVDCTDESLPLAFQFFKDTSLSLSDTGEWLTNAEGEELSVSGPSGWKSLRFNAERQVWNQLNYIEDTTFDGLEYILSPLRTTTCLPKSTCAILHFDILDVPVERVISEDAGYPFEFPIIIYNGIEIGPDEVDSTFDHCIYQFGESCATEVICSDSEISQPYTTEAKCAEGQNTLAIEVKTDIYDYETSLLITDMDTWKNGIVTGSPTLNETGTFDWGFSRWNAPFTEEPASYTFESCVPDGQCGVVVLGDSFSDGIVNGGMTLVYNNTAILFGPRGAVFSTCVFQFGDCETRLDCYDSENPPPPFNPDLECDSGKSLAFDLRADCCSSYENVISVTDLDSWNEGLAQNFPSLDATGVFPWGSFQIDTLEDNTSNRFATCVPDDVCAIIAINDNFGDGLIGGGLTVVYDSAEIMLGPQGNQSFTDCEFQFGACDTQFVCYGVDSPRPPFNPEIECQNSKPLAFDLQADCCSSSENVLSVTDLDSFDQGLAPNFPSLDTAGNFAWGSFQIDNLQDNASNRFSTCVPNDVCAIVAIKDSFGDGLASGGLTVVYDNAEIMVEPIAPGFRFEECVLQFGACETQILCFDSENPRPPPPPPPPYNPEIECQSGKKPLAFDLRADCCSSYQNAMIVTDLDSWNQGLSPLFPALATMGFSTWGDFRIGNFEDYTSNRFTTCVPNDVCAIIAVNDNFGDGIADGGLTVVFDNTEVMLGPQGDHFTDCVFQFGACEAQFICYDIENPLPPLPSPPAFNPVINCTGGTSLAFDFKSDATSEQYAITVTDFYAWRRGILSNVSILDDTGYFEWDSVQISRFERGASQRFSTCVPSGVCGIVALEDHTGIGIDSDGWFTVYYDEEKISAVFATESFRTCQYQFGSCGQEASCTASLPPAYNPEIECIGGKSLAFDFHSDLYPSENDLLVTNWESWVQDSWSNSSSVLNQTGFFEWGTVQILDFDSVSSHHFRTCVPSDVCGVILLSDSLADGVFSDEGLRVVFDQEEIPLTFSADTRFSFCEFQFGSCGQGAYCSESRSVAPTSAPNEDDGVV